MVGGIAANRMRFALWFETAIEHVVEDGLLVVTALGMRDALHSCTSLGGVLQSCLRKCLQGLLIE